MIQHYDNGWDDATNGLGYDRLRYGFYNGLLDPVSENHQVGDILKLGTFSVGRYFDLPVSPDLNLSITHDYSGIKSQKTISGDEITNIN